MKKSQFKFKCDKCVDGIIIDYMHVDNGLCWKCNGVGLLKHDPTADTQTYKADEDEDLKDYQFFLKEQATLEEADKWTRECVMNGWYTN